MSNEIRDNIKDRLDPKVLAAAIILGVVEFELFLVPRAIVDIAQQDAWLSVLLGSLLATLGTYLLVRLATRFPGENLFQFSKKVWGRPIALIIALGFLSFWAVYLIMLFEDSSAANKLLFLPLTPSLVPMLLLAFAAAWLVAHGFPAVIRLFQLMLVFFFPPLLLIYVLSLRIVEWDNFLPVLANGIMPVVKGAVYYAGVLQGLELILFLSPFLTSVKKAVRPALAGITVVNLLGLTHTVIAIGILGTENIREALWPGIDTISLIELPGFPVERYELLLTLPWLIGMFTTMCLVLYLLSYSILQVFNLRHKKVLIFAVAGAVVAATYLYPNYTWALTARQHWYLPTLLFVYTIPVLTLLAAIIRGKRNEQ